MSVLLEIGGSLVDGRSGPQMSSKKTVLGQCQRPNSGTALCREIGIASRICCSQQSRTVGSYVEHAMNA